MMLCADLPTFTRLSCVIGATDHDASKALTLIGENLASYKRERSRVMKECSMGCVRRFAYVAVLLLMGVAPMFRC